MHGGGEEGMEGRGRDGDVDVFSPAVAAEGEQRGTADEDETTSEILGEEGYCSGECFKEGGLLAGADERHFEIGYGE